MTGDIAEALAKVREIETQAQTALAELPVGSIAASRLRHITILAKFARMKLQGSIVDPLDPMSEHSGQPKPRRTQ